MGARGARRDLKAGPIEADGAGSQGTAFKSGELPAGTVLFEEDELEPLSFAPGRLRRSSQAAPPPSGATRDFEVVSSSFGSEHAFADEGRDGDPLFQRLTWAISDVSEGLLRRALVASESQARARFLAHSESLEKLLQYPAVAHYLRVPGVAVELLAQLRRFSATQQAWPEDQEYGDVLLKASATAIHLAPCVGYWRSSPEVPARVKALLTTENVYGSVLHIARTRKSRETDRLIARYTSVVGELSARAELNLEVRNPILWPWCRFGIDTVTFPFAPPGERTAEDLHLLDAFADLKLVLILLNVLIDETADAVQDPELVRVLSEVPEAGGAFGIAPWDAYAALRGRLRAIGREAFEPYFDLFVEGWTYAVERMQELGGDAYGELEGDLAADYAAIMACMRLSVDLNCRPGEVFHLGPEALREAYGAGDIGTILAPNVNRFGFYLVDRMRLRRQDPERHAALAAAGTFDAYAEVAALFQEMHTIGNAVATGGREADSDDLSSELFKLANDRLNATSGWDLPAHFSALPGARREDALLQAFALKKAARQERSHARPGSPEHEAAHERYVSLGEDIERLIEVSGAQERSFAGWEGRRAEAASIMERAGLPDREELLAANDLMLVLHLLYKGKI
jgi:hypothetical protein